MVAIAIYLARYYQRATMLRAMKKKVKSQQRPAEEQAMLLEIAEALDGHAMGRSSLTQLMAAAYSVQLARIVTGPRKRLSAARWRELHIAISCLIRAEITGKPSVDRAIRLEVMRVYGSRSEQTIKQYLARWRTQATHWLYRLENSTDAAGLDRSELLKRELRRIEPPRRR